jgi:3-dehydroquinate synthase class II
MCYAYVSSIPGNRDKIADLKVGDSVTICDVFQSEKAPHIMCRGKVERITYAQVVVRNEHGNLCRFWKRNARTVGYVWPTVTSKLGNDKGCVIWADAETGVY